MVIRLHTPARLTCPTASRDCHSLQSNCQNPKDKKRKSTYNCKSWRQAWTCASGCTIGTRANFGTQLGPYGDKDDDDTQHNEQQQHQQHQRWQQKANRRRNTTQKKTGICERMNHLGTRSALGPIWTRHVSQPEKPIGNLDTNLEPPGNHCLHSFFEPYWRMEFVAIGTAQRHGNPQGTEM